MKAKAAAKSETPTHSFEWDVDRQQWYCKACDLFIEKTTYRCHGCGKWTPDSLTWWNVMDFIKKEKLDQAEYFMISGIYHPAERVKVFNSQVWNEDPYWSERTCYIPVYWVVGGSEGYYVHVDRMWSNGNGSGEVTSILLGKFWGIDEAEGAVGKIQRFINGGGTRG